MWAATGAARMNAVIVTCVGAIILMLFGPILFRKSRVLLVSNGKVVAVVKRSFAPPWREAEYGIYAGNSNLFSMWGDTFEFPIFVHAFQDGRRFLCIVDDDTAILVFVVDFTGSSSSVTNLPKWPPDEYTRTYLAQRATNRVTKTHGAVRLPNCMEIRQASCEIESLTDGQFRAASLPTWDLGFYRFYWPKKALLSALDTNRSSVWPHWQE